MAHRSLLRYVVLLFIASVAQVRGQAQAQPQDRQVTATGTATITAPPEILRVSVLLKTDGKDAKDALTKLNAEKQSAKEKLAQLHVPADNIKFADPAMGDKPLTPQQRQMQMVMRMQNRAGGKKPTTAPSNVDVTTTVTADVPLKAGNGDEMLIAVADLQAKLRDLFKAAPKAAATPEEQEVIEEMQGADDANNGGSEAKPGEPVFLFVHVITEAEQNKALADAFNQAKTSAQRLAKAAGSDLGELKTLSAVSSTGGPEANDAQSVFYAAMVTGRAPTADQAATVEATGAQPGPVSSRITVNVGFGLKP